MQAWMQHSPSKVVFAALRMTEMQNVTGSFSPTGFRTTKRAKKKKTSLSVGLLFCGCQDSNLEQYEDRTSLHDDKKILARPLANTTG